MSTPWLGVLMVGVTSPDQLDAFGLTAAEVAGCILGDGSDAVELTARVLSRTFEELPVPLRHRVPIVMAVTDYCVAGTSGLVRRYDEFWASGRRLRPSEVISPEPARMIQGFAARSGWTGSGHLLASRYHASQQALCWAYGAVLADRVEAMVVCELVREPTRGTYLVVAVPVLAPWLDATTVSRLPWQPATGAGTDTGHVPESLLLQVARAGVTTP